MKEQEYEIIEIEPDSSEDVEKIVDAYIKISIAPNKFLWVFIPNWTHYFPYHPEPSKWGLGEKLIKNLIGKTATLEFELINLAPMEKTTEQNKKIIQARLFGAANNTKIIGTIVKKVLTKQEIRNVETIYIDCELEIRINTKKGQFEIGDTIKTRGILNAYIKKLDGEVLK